MEEGGRFLSPTHKHHGRSSGSLTSDAPARAANLDKCPDGLPVSTCKCKTLQSPEVMLPTRQETYFFSDALRRASTAQLQKHRSLLHFPQNSGKTNLTSSRSGSTEIFCESRIQFLFKELNKPPLNTIGRNNIPGRNNE